MSRIQELEKELNDLKQSERDYKRRQLILKEETFKKETKLDIYSASDYAGCSNGDFSFYYGYEQEFCSKHGFIDHTNHQECEEPSEWTFVAYRGSVEVAQYKQTELWYEYEEPLFMLLAGVTKFTGVV